MDNLTEKIDKLIGDYLKENELDLYDVSWIKQYGFRVLQVLVEKKGGISIDELTAVNEVLSEKLDNDDVSDNEYMLEVSSPGAEKPLRNEKDYVNACGEYIHIKLEKEEYDGYLLEVNEETIKIKINIKGRIKELLVDRKEIKKARLAIKF